MFGGFGTTPAAAPGGFGAAPAPAAGFGAAPAAAAPGGFGAAPAPAAGFGAAPAPAAGFGAAPAAAAPAAGFGAAPAAAAPAAAGFGAPAAAPAPGGFGAKTPAAAPGGFGAAPAPAAGFGAAPAAAAPAAGFGAAPAAAAPAAAGFGAPAAAPAPGGFGAKTPAAAPGGFGAAPAPAAGFGAPAAAPGGFGAAPAPAAGGFGAAPTAAPSSSKIGNAHLVIVPMTAEQAKTDLKGRTLGSILEQWDRGLNADYDNFVRCAREVKVRDRDVVEGGNAVLAMEAELDEAIRFATATKHKLREISTAQTTFAADLQRLGEAVGSFYSKHEGAFSANDKAREEVYATVLAAYDETQCILQRLERYVEMHNDSAVAASRTGDMGRVLRVIDLQLTALQTLARDTAELEGLVSYAVMR